MIENVGSFFKNLHFCFFLVKIHVDSKNRQEPGSVVPPLDGDRGTRATGPYLHPKHRVFEMLIPELQVLLPCSIVNSVC